MALPREGSRATASAVLVMWKGRTTPLLRFAKKCSRYAHLSASSRGRNSSSLIVSSQRKASMSSSLEADAAIMELRRFLRMIRKLLGSADHRERILRKTASVGFPAARCS